MSVFVVLMFIITGILPMFFSVRSYAYKDMDNAYEKRIGL